MRWKQIGEEAGADTSVIVGASQEKTLRLMTVGDDGEVSDAVVVAGRGAEGELAAEGTATELSLEGPGNCVSAQKSRFFIAWNMINLLTNCCPLSDTVFPTLGRLCNSFCEGGNDSKRKHVSLSKSLDRGGVRVQFS